MDCSRNPKQEEEDKGSSQLCLSATQTTTSFPFSAQPSLPSSLPIVFGALVNAQYEQEVNRSYCTLILGKRIADSSTPRISSPSRFLFPPSSSFSNCAPSTANSSKSDHHACYPTPHIIHSFCPVNFSTILRSLHNYHRFAQPWLT